MKQQLKDLTVGKIAFVDAGDNPEADILIYKRKPEESGADEEKSTVQNENAGFFKKLCQFLAKACGIGDDEANEIIEKSVADKKTSISGKTDKADDELPDDEELEDEEKNKNPADKKCQDVGKERGGEQNKEGGYTDMSKIDKSRLTAEELAQLEAIEKKTLIDDAGDEPGSVEKGKNTRVNEDDDIYKGLHPAVKAELERLTAAVDQAEDNEMLATAKKYEILGKEPEALAKTLKGLKKAGGTAYADMIGILDVNLKAMEDAGVFSEVGKRGADGEGDPSDKAWAKIEAHAKDILKAKPELSWEQAVDEAAMQHPELIHEYEDNL